MQFHRIFTGYTIGGPHHHGGCRRRFTTYILRRGSMRPRPPPPRLPHGKTCPDKKNSRRVTYNGSMRKHPNQEGQQDLENSAVIFRLSHGGDVEADGNFLFTASQKAMGLTAAEAARDLRLRMVRRFLEDLRSVNEVERENIDSAIRNMYAPDLRYGWGIHVVHEVKLLAKKVDR